MQYVHSFFLLIGLVLSFQVSAISSDEENSPVTIELIQQEQTIQAGQPFWLAVKVKIEKGWHIYWKNPGDAGFPIELEWKMADGFTLLDTQWPIPEKFTVSDMVGFGYSGEVIFLAKIMAPSVIEGVNSIQVFVKWLVCSSLTCQPGEAAREIILPRAIESPQSLSESQQLFSEAFARLPRNDVSVHTARRNGIIQFKLSEQNFAHKAEKAYFFSEEKGIIDYLIEPTLEINDNQEYVINLKEGERSLSKNQNVKGVLVLYSSTTPPKGITIDHTIPSEEFGVLSMVDPVQSSIAYLPDNKEMHSFSFEGGLAWAFLLAFIGGALLNLMPCVLPVLSFKVMGFVKMAKQSRSLTIQHGGLFSLGVLCSFWLLASIMLILRAYGQTVGWGFQLQEPLFIVVLVSLLFAFALSLFGVFEMGMTVSSWAGEAEVEKKQTSPGYMSSFFSGVLATAVATPCTGPFLGSVVGFAVTLPTIKALAIFTFVALGMCFPYLMLAIFPSLLRFIPKPGAWMETFKQLMGFILLASVLWLIWVFSAQTNSLSVVCLLAGLLCLACALWIYGKSSSRHSRIRKVFSYTLMALFLIAGWQAMMIPRSTWSQEQKIAMQKDAQWDEWQDFSPELVAQLQKERKPILIDFTAKWCLICQVNHLVLSTDEVQKQLQEAGVVKLKADWTKSDPMITKELSKFGRNSVPLYVMYGSIPGQNPIILPQILTPEIVTGHIQSLSTEIALQ
jgi:thiol:disulfide interchange protein/DsbC/DsbD-like thiol-disulfide interchange protein